MKAGGFARTLRLAGEQRELRHTAVAGNHQRTARIVGPVAALLDDLETQGARVPRRRFMPIRNEQLHVIDRADGIATLGLPKFNGVALGIVQAGESPVRVRLRIDGDVDPAGTQLRDEGVETGDAEIDHPALRGAVEVRRVGRKWLVDGRSGSLPPRPLAVVGRRRGDAQVRFVPFLERFGIGSAKEDAADAGDFFHRDVLPPYARRKQPTMWSFTRPTACMNA